MLFLVRNENSPLGIYFVAVALDFQVFLAQTIRLEKSNFKEPEISHCCRDTSRHCKMKKKKKKKKQLNARSANQEQVFLPLEQSGLSIYFPSVKGADDK